MGCLGLNSGGVKHPLVLGSHEVEGNVCVSLSVLDKDQKVLF